jgi:hypothetical protein
MWGLRWIQAESLVEGKDPRAQERSMYLEKQPQLNSVDSYCNYNIHILIRGVLLSRCKVAWPRSWWGFEALLRRHLLRTLLMFPLHTS